MFKKFIVAVISLSLVLALGFTAQASAADSYIRVDVPGDTTEIRLSREMYTATKNVNASTLGLDEELKGITDIYGEKNGGVLILCGNKSRLVRINSDYTFDKEIIVTDESGATVSYTGARGVYSDGKHIYIADTGNARILIADYNGKINNIMELPDSELIPEGFIYQPISIKKDHQGYTYILSMGCYYGVLMYSPEYKFLGFYGSNTVEASALDTLAYLWDRLVSNDEKKSNSVKTLPYSFSDFCFDNEGYMVTCTGKTSETQTLSQGQIRKISHNGSDILYKRTLEGESIVSSSMNFLETEPNVMGNAQSLVSVAVGKNDYIYALDGVNGTIYVYDYQCNLMSAFGGGIGEGEQLGVFSNPVKLTFNGDELLVADAKNSSITIFNITNYGKLLCDAQTLYLSGDYVEAKKLWQEVLSLNRNCQLAYRGLTMAYYNEGDYEAAMETAKISVDYTIYDMARKQLISNKVAENFIWIVLIAFVLLAAGIFSVVYIRKHNIKLIKNKNILLLLNTPIHPFQAFDDLKYKKLGSTKMAVGLTVMFYIASVLNVVAVGFLYQNTLIRNYNALFTLAGTIGLVLLWSVCYWLVCAIFSGKGTFKEVYVSTVYSIMPWIVFIFIRVILTNILPLSAAGILNGFQVALLIYTFYLLAISMMKMQEYDFFKFLLTTLVALFFMLLVVFVIFMFAILLRQVGEFVYSVYEEIAFR